MKFIIKQVPIKKNSKKYIFFSCGYALGGGGGGGGGG